MEKNVIILGCESPPRMPVGESSLDLDPLQHYIMILLGWGASWLCFETALVFERCS